MQDRSKPEQSSSSVLSVRDLSGAEGEVTPLRPPGGIRSDGDIEGHRNNVEGIKAMVLQHCKA